MEQSARERGTRRKSSIVQIGRENETERGVDVHGREGRKRRSGERVTKREGKLAGRAKRGRESNAGGGRWILG